MEETASESHAATAGKSGCGDSSCTDSRCDESHSGVGKDGAVDAADVPPSPLPKSTKGVPPTEEMDVTVATQYGKMERVRHLFATENVDVNRPDAEGCHLLHWAAINNRVELIKFLLSQGALVDQIGGDLLASPLHWATRSGHLESVVALVLAGADPLLRDKEGLTCVMVAAAFEHKRCLAYLLAKLGDNFDINATDNEGRTAALWSSCRNHEPDCLRLLLGVGASLDVHDSQQRSPLHWTAFIGSTDNLRLVLKTNQCDPTRRDKDGLTALDHAENSRQIAIQRPMRAHEWRFRRRMGQARPKGIIAAAADRIRYDENIHRKIAPFLPLLCYLLIGLLLEQNVSSWLKTAVIAGFGYPIVYFFRIYVDSDSVMMSLPLYISLGTKFWLYTSYFALSFHLRSAPWYVDVIFWIVIPAGLFFFYKAVTTDPGTIRANHDRDVFNKFIIQRTEGVIDKDTDLSMSDFCFTCLVRRPLRSKHCSTCDRCVARFDHHCPWIANCVARDNLKHFLAYLFFLGISLCWDMHGNVILAVSKLEEPPRWDGGFWTALQLCWSLASVAPWAFWNYVNAALYGISVIFLFACQLYQVCSNLTTNERMRHFRYKHFTDEKTKKFRNPFSRGPFRNFFDSLDIAIPNLIQPSPIDWRRCYTMQEVQFHYQGHASPSKMA